MGFSKALSGANFKVYINNSIFGVATGFECDLSPNRESLLGIDEIVPVELAPTVYTVRGRIDYLRVNGDGGLEGRGVAALPQDILFEKYISISIVDRKTDQIVFQCDRASVTGQHWSIKSKRLMEGTFTFEGISWNAQV